MVPAGGVVRDPRQEPPRVHHDRRLRALLHGSGVLSDNIDIVPSTRPANLERLGQAYIALNARTPKNKQLRLDPGEQPKALTRMLTRSGPLNIILTPAGTNGYDDLRRKAIREPLGFGVRTTLASLDDIIRTTAAQPAARRPKRGCRDSTACSTSRRPSARIPTSSRSAIHPTPPGPEQ